MISPESLKEVREVCEAHHYKIGPAVGRADLEDLLINSVETLLDAVEELKAYISMLEKENSELRSERLATMEKKQ